MTGLQAAPTPTPALAGRRVLVVDDAPFVASVIARVLAAAGAEATVVHDGAAALAAIETARFDVLITDYDMPGMNGLAVVAGLRGSAGASRDTPAVVLSGHDTDGIAGRLLDAGADAVVGKPVDASELLSTLARLMRSRGPAAA